MQKKLKIMVAGAAAAGVVAVAGVAYAAYARTNDADTVGKSESFKALNVSGQWVGGPGGAGSGLLPGEAGDVKIIVGVSGDNTVAAKVKSIQAKQITAAQISGIAEDKKPYCASMLVPATYSPDLILAKGASNVHITLKNAVTLKDEAEIDCEGMSFTTGWTVTFEPTRVTAGQLGTNGTADVNPTG